MAVRVGINGFGRIGRLVFRVMAEKPQDFEIVAINDLSDAKHLALLLKYDSVHGQFAGTVEAGENALIVNGKEIRITQEKDPANLPWKALKCQVALESTGLRRLVVAGGVGANRQLLAALDAEAGRRGFEVFYPEPELCTDNGAMIAWAGAERLALGLTDTLDTVPHARWPLDKIQRPAVASTFVARKTD